MDAWTHPELGAFHNPNGDDWQQNRDFDAFGIFANVARRPTLVLPPSYSAETDEPGPPDEDVIRLALLVLEQLPALVEGGVRALWEDLNGTGPARSGMWWHNGLHDAFEEMEIPEDETALYDVLKPRNVTCASSAYKWIGPVARIQFDAEFEHEHGVSFLTDGKSIIGVGYAYDSSPFRET